jgi:hypothetical protein
VPVPEEEVYAILADVLREARAMDNRDSSMDDDDLKSKTSKDTYRGQRMRKSDRDDKKLFLDHAPED